jgi:hypothetical protein
MVAQPDLPPRAPSTALILAARRASRTAFTSGARRPSSAAFTSALSASSAPFTSAAWRAFTSVARRSSGAHGRGLCTGPSASEVGATQESHHADEKAPLESGASSTLCRGG